MSDEEQKNEVNELEARAKSLTVQIDQKNEAFNRKCGTLIYETKKELDKVESLLDSKEKEFDEFEEKKKKELLGAEELFDNSLREIEQEVNDIKE